MSETKIPGLKAEHAIITPACRERGDAVVVADAMERIASELLAVMDAEANAGANFHLVLTVERP